MSNLNLKHAKIKSPHDSSLFMNKINASIQSIKVKNPYEVELKRLWSYFIKAFEFDFFYDDVSFNGKNQLSNPERIKAIKMLNDFFIKYKISYSENFGLICEDQHLLKEEKIWIMYVVIMGQTLEMTDILKIFKNSIKNGINAIKLFEFFLIFISKYNSECFQSTLLYNEDIFPEEFLEIYKENMNKLNSIFGIDYNNHHITNNIQQFNCEFSFHTRDEDTDIKIDLEGVRLDNTRNTDYEEDKSLHEKIIDKNVLEQDDCLMTEILQDELINDTALNDKSPAVLGRYQSKNLDTNKMCTDTSPTLDSYLLPNVGSLDKKISNCNSEDDVVKAYNNYNDNLNLNLNNLAIRIDFGTDEKAQDVSDSNSGGDYDHDMTEENQGQVCDNECTDVYSEQNYSEDPREEFNVEDYYNDDNLFLIDSNFKDRDHFAICILIGKLKERFSQENNVTYMITPIRNSFDNDLFEKIEVQKDLDDIRSSNYSNFVYFPYNPKLMDLINYSELM